MTLSFVDEYKIRLEYGPVELEFFLLGDAKIAVRDCARNAPNATRLRQFCNMFIRFVTDFFCHTQLVMPVHLIYLLTPLMLSLRLSFFVITSFLQPGVA